MLNIVLAFVLIKFLVYPGLALVLATSNPVVAVVSESMEHNAQFDDWWEAKANFYEKFNITKTDFENFRFKNGFNKGDLMILKGVDPSTLSIGNTVVFRGVGKEPVIHRLVSKKQLNGNYLISTKGDSNDNQLAYEKDIPPEQLIGKAVVRIPVLGYVKIIVTDAITLILRGP